MVKALLQTKEDMQNYMKQYREINKDKICGTTASCDDWLAGDLINLY